jgi:hypothetical protein
VAEYAAAGKRIDVPEQACPVCGDRLTGWSGYRRWLRDDGEYRIWVRRGRCPACRHTHALLPDFVHARRLDVVEVIEGDAVQTVFAGTLVCDEAIAAALAALPPGHSPVLKVAFSTSYAHRTRGAPPFSPAGSIRGSSSSPPRSVASSWCASSRRRTGPSARPAQRPTPRPLDPTVLTR